MSQQYIESQCACMICKMMCMMPCFPTPAEAQALIDAGYSHRLEMKYEGVGLYIIRPKARAGFCAFFSARGNCVLHKKGLKPLEGRLASCDGKYNGQALHDHVESTWATAEAKQQAMNFHADRLMERAK